MPSSTTSLLRARAPELALVAVTLVWSCTFSVTQTALQHAPPFTVMLLRFVIGFAALAAVLGRGLGGLTRAELRAGAPIGVLVFAMHTFLTLGLQHVPSSRAAFLATMYVPLVPLLQRAFFRTRVAPAAVAGIVVAFAGLLVLTARGGLGIGFGVGDWLVLGNALTMAVNVTLVSRLGAGRDGTPLDPLRVSLVQTVVVTVLALAAVAVVGAPVPRLTPALAGSALFLGLFTTAFGLAAMTWAQRTVSPTRAATIYSTQTVWAGAIGAAAGEPMGVRTILGSLLILAGVLLSGRRGGRSAPPASAPPVTREQPSAPARRAA